MLTDNVLGKSFRDPCVHIKSSNDSRNSFQKRLVYRTRKQGTLKDKSNVGNVQNSSLQVLWTKYYFPICMTRTYTITIDFRKRIRSSLSYPRGIQESWWATKIGRNNLRSWQFMIVPQLTCSLHILLNVSTCVLKNSKSKGPISW